MTSTVPLSHALVLTAGLGTRLRPLTLVRAKPAIPIAGEPIIRRIIRWLVANAVTNITLNLHYLPETLAGVAGDGSDLRATIRYSWEQPMVLGSAGGPRQALDIIGAETFFLINGDTLTDVDLKALAAAHFASDAKVTLALLPNVEPHRYGGVKLAADGRVLGFAPRGPAATGSFHFIGAQIASRSAFDALPAGQPVNSIGGWYDVLLAREPNAIRGFVTDARFWDIGTVDDYWHTSFAWSNNVETLSSTAHITPSATIRRSIVWDQVEVGADVSLEECIVTDRVRVADGSAYRRTILIRAADGSTHAFPLEIT